MGSSSFAGGLLPVPGVAGSFLDSSNALPVPLDPALARLPDGTEPGAPAPPATSRRAERRRAGPSGPDQGPSRTTCGSWSEAWPANSLLQWTASYS
jgi:hypothetical protein